MSRKLRIIETDTVAIRQEGHFFADETEKKLYEQTMQNTAQMKNADIYGYVLEKNRVFIFCKSQNVPSFMQSLNSSFMRKRNKLNPQNEAYKIKRYEINPIFANDFDAVLAYIQKNEGKVFADVKNTNLSLDKELEIKKFRKRETIKLEPINKQKHKNLKYHQDAFPLFPFMEILANEVIACSDDLVVVFTNEIVPRLVVLLGQKQNVLIDENYKGYIPNSLINYPFFLAELNGNQILCIDSEAKQFKGDGEKLFENGKETEFLNNLIKNMKNYNIKAQKTKIALQEIKKYGILESKELNIYQKNKNKISIKGFCVVNRKKLSELDDKTLADFARKGYLELIYMHLKSLSNLQYLANRIISHESK